MSEDFHQRHQSSFFFPPESDEGFEAAAGVHQQHQLVQETPYETAGMLSEMFDFSTRPSVTVAAAPNPELVDSSAEAMQLFMTDPQSRSPPPAHQFPSQAGFHSQPAHYTWIPEGSGAGGAIEGQGLSLSLASSLQLEGSHHEMMFFNGRAASSSSSNPLQQHQLQFGFGTASSNSVFSLAAVNVLRNSKYTRPAQEILEEFCSVGRGHLNKNINTAKLAGAGANVKEVPVPVAVPAMSPADRMEHQRRKVKLASMLDEVERRYSHYCEQMQMVVNSFDMVMGFGAAVPYTALAQKAMSRHFRCLKDAIQAQLKQSCEMLGEKESAGGNGITKGETPRLKVLEQSLRKQRAFHQMGMMEQEAWRPQRGLPERSVNVLRAWLFEHFLNPYPSDADKHLLARQTGLSRNQVANWFINARVRLWKPMIEDMYQQESKAHEELQNDDVQQALDHDHQHKVLGAANRESESNTSAQTPTQQPPQQQPPMSSAAVVGPTNGNANPQGFIQTTTTSSSSFSHVVVDPCNNNRFIGTTTTGDAGVDTCHHHDSSDLDDGPTMIRFGTTSATNAGDVSLTLGLRHSGNHPQEKGTAGFSFRDFGRAS